MKYVENIIKNISNKVSGREIPLHILKQSGFTYQMLSGCMKDALSRGILSDSIQLANITPVYKQDKVTDKEIYRLVSVLLLFSKIFEKVIYDQLCQYLEKYLNSLLCGFQKAHSTQHALFKPLQAWKEELNKSGIVRTIFMAVTYLKPLTVYLIMFLFQNLKPMVLINMG